MSAWDDLYYYRVRVHRCYDGDSITEAEVRLGFNVLMEKQELRFFAVDTPEMRTKVKIEKRLAKTALDFVMELLPEDDEGLLLSIKDKSGKFGRALGYLFTNADGELDHLDGLPPPEMSINHMLIRNHLAYEYYGGKKPTSSPGFWQKHYLKHRNVLDPLLERYGH